ncbi:TIGR03016 family PEP-CTERM system-associated outer membrane protein [Roseomonas sp. CAU 1739]|uniref:TIGR03016 family PEP-CTERM system-associated outer membrane protein n=1 Tax=Roseomonas sp. CAU 1739 TaxID=3140364 RepID=UPI00325BBBE7
MPDGSRLRRHLAAAAGALCLAAPPLAAQESGGGGSGGLAGPVGAPVGGASLGAPVEPFATWQPAGPGRMTAGGAASSAPNVRLGPFGAPFAAPSEAAGAGDPGRAWNIVPSIAVDVGATDNVFQTHSDRRRDAYTVITPAILIDGATERVRAIINYAPSAQLYATYTDQNRVAQLGNGMVLAELIPGRLFLDMRGSASLGTSSGGFVPSGVQTVNRNDQVQNYNFQVSPYYVHRFGSAATAQLGYAFQYSAQEGTTQFQPGATLPSFNNQDYIGNRGYLVVRSGEDLGRLALQGRVDGTVFSGTGVYDGAHVYVASLEARYAITPTIAVLLEGGYEDIEYAGTNPNRIQDAIWSVGARLTPTPESFLTVRYGHRGGFDSPSLQAGLQLGGFTRLTASYVEQLATSATNAQDLLSTTTLDELGNPVDSQSGAPVLYANAFFPAQSGLFRMKTGAVTLTQSWPRDSVSLSAYYQEQIPISAAPGTLISQTTGYYGGISWTHELTPSTALNLGVQIGRSEYGNQPATTVIYANAALYHQINDRLSGVVRFIYSTQTSDVAASEYSQSVILAGLRQTF